MNGSTLRRSGKGHRFGGLFSLAPGALAALAGLAGLGGLGGCGGPQAVEGSGGPAPSGPGRPVEVYRQLGLMAGPDAFPAVAGLTVLAGPSDSALVLFGLSLPASALRFEREGSGFAAEYVVSLRFSGDDGAPTLVDRRERVRVSTFAETTRGDEAVVFQTPVLLPPGRYVVTVRVRDALSARGLEAGDTLEVPDHRAAPSLAAPVSVHRASPRSSVRDTPSIVLNPRRSVPYGGPPPQVYVEAYGAAPDSAVLELADEGGRTVWARPVALEPGAGMGAAVVELPVDSLPLGRFVLRARAGELLSPTSALLVAISDRWAASRFDEVLELLGYIAGPEELADLAAAGAEGRRELWEAFWTRRDPIRATPGNEFRDAFFERVRYATERFPEAGTPGWRTHRGEVYIVLGPPTFFAERQVGPDAAVTGEPNAQEWIYEDPSTGRLTLLFVDRSGLGTFRMTAGAESDFRSVARRLRERP